MTIMKIILIATFLAGLIIYQNVIAESNVNQMGESSERIDLMQRVNEILAAVTDKNIFNADTCHDYIENKTSKAYTTSTSEFKLPEAGNSDQSLSIIENLFKIRLVLHEKLRKFDRDGNLGVKCIDSIREANQFIRFAEEYLIEWAGFKDGLTELEEKAGKPLSFFSVEKPHKMVNEKEFGNDYELKTGDVLVIRGNANVSAMIARLGDEESIFSHSAIVGEDEKEGKKYVVEALIPKGLIVTPLDKWLIETRDARVAVYRYEHSTISKKAGQEIYKHTKGMLDKGVTAGYDFAMDESDRTMFFCSEVAQYAYWLASNKEVLLPKYRTAACKLRTSTSFFDDMGIKTEGSLFSPADIEVDPRFELVVDYRDVSENRLLNARRKDAVLQSIYQWMTQEQNRYNFYSSPKYFFLATLAKTARQLGYKSELFPKHIPFNTLETLLRYEDLSSILLKNLEELEKNKLAGSPSMSFKDLMTANEKLRKDDCKQYSKNLPSNEIHQGSYKYISSQNTSKFHDFFRGPCSEFAEEVATSSF